MRRYRGHSAARLAKAKLLLLQTDENSEMQEKRNYDLDEGRRDCRRLVKSRLRDFFAGWIISIFAANFDYALFLCKLCRKDQTVYQLIDLDA